MLKQLFNDIIKPANAAGPDHSTLTEEAVEKRCEDSFGINYLYGYTALKVVQDIVGVGQAVAEKIVEWLRKNKFLKVVKCDQQLSGEVYKLAPRGVDYVESIVGLTRGSKYDTTARISRKGFVAHDLSSQQVVARMVRKHGLRHYLPEAGDEVSRKEKYFDVVIMPEPDLLVGVEIERSPKSGEERKATIARAIRATRLGDVDFAVFVLPSASAVEHYEEVLYEDELVVKRKVGRRWATDHVMYLSEEDLMRIAFVVGRSDIWKGAM